MSMTLPEITAALRQLRLSGIRATLETRVLEAQVTQVPFLETFSVLLQDELDRRQSKLQQRRYQLSGLDERLTLADFDWGYNPKIPKRLCFELHTLKFIAEGDCALFIGMPGTGKSHIAKAIAYAGLRTGLRVVYAEADELLNTLAEDTAAERRKRLKPLLDADLVVLDDLFLARHFAAPAADELQHLLHKRYKLRRSVLITSNRVIGDWEKYLGDAAQTTAILDRLMHRSVLVEFKGKSYRLNQAAARIAKGVAPE